IGHDVRIFNFLYVASFQKVISNAVNKKTVPRLFVERTLGDAFSKDSNGRRPLNLKPTKSFHRHSLGSSSDSSSASLRRSDKTFLAVSSRMEKSFVLSKSDTWTIVFLCVPLCARNAPCT